MSFWPQGLRAELSTESILTIGTGGCVTPVTWIRDEAYCDLPSGGRNFT